MMTMTTPTKSFIIPPHKWITIWEWRDSTNKLARVTNEPLFDNDSESWEVNVEFPNGDEHYAYWDEGEKSWVSGNI